MEEIEILKEETYVDRSKWPNQDGPWRDEPDRVHFVVKEFDMDALIVRGPSGALCGYVAVEPSHPAHGVSYNRVQVDVHGGLTYGSMCQEDGKICHVPREGKPHDVFWLGFDCAHSGDVTPSYDRSFRFSDYEYYKSRRYVEQECISLARQLAKREPLRGPYDWELED